MPTNKLSTVRADPEAVEKVVCPDTLRVPCDTSDEVAVITPPVVVPTVRVLIFAFVAVRLVITALIALRKLEKILLEVALMIEAY